MEENILNKIIQDKKNWIESRKKKQPFISFQKKITANTRNFSNVLQKHRPFLILECKKHSPSLGLLRKDFDLLHISSIYQKYASAISVLTDEKYFHGDFRFINQVRTIVHQPILCKDFFIDPYQIYLARYYHADAILLMLSILNDHQYTEMSRIANSMNLGIITEINNIQELNRAIKLKAKIIGINNRNLHDLSINIDNTRCLASLIPKNIIIISESGIKKYNEIRELSTLVHGFLIGSNLMLQKDLDLAIRSIIFGNNKVCGLTRNIDACVALKYGAIYGGLIFVKNSPRYINKKNAEKIIFNNDLKYVGVFQNETIQEILYLSKDLSLHAIQLHGNENQEYIDKLRNILSPKIQIWKAFSIFSTIPKLNLKNIDIYILDSMFGGSNTPFDWLQLKNKKLHNIILAGGINNNNCIEASKLNCFGLDLNSGIEISAGIKSSKKIQSLFKKLRYL